MSAQCLPWRMFMQARAFYEGLFGLEAGTRITGINVSFTCGLSRQQEFDWLASCPKEQIVQRPNNVELCFEETDFDAFSENCRRIRI